MVPENRVRKEMVEVGRRLYSRGFVAASDGNITVRVSGDQLLATPTGVSKGFMDPEMMVKVNLDGKKLSGTMEPSSELNLHLEVYRVRPDVTAVLHAHPPAATAFAAAGRDLDKPVLPEVVVMLGKVPVAGYGTPSTEEVPLQVRPYLENHDAVLMANHGVLTLGEDLFKALFKMESVEHFALISIYARMLGGERELPPGEVKKLLQVRKEMGLGGRHPWL